MQVRNGSRRSISTFIARAAQREQCRAFMPRPPTPETRPAPPPKASDYLLGRSSVGTQNYCSYSWCPIWPVRRRNGWCSWPWPHLPRQHPSRPSCKHFMQGHVGTNAARMGCATQRLEPVHVSTAFSARCAKLVHARMGVPATADVSHRRCR